MAIDPKEAAETAGLIGAVAYFISVASGKFRQGKTDVAAEANKEAERLISMLKEQRAVQDTKIDTLDSKLDKAIELFMEFACQNAPTCKRRKAPDSCLTCGIADKAVPESA